MVSPGTNNDNYDYTDFFEAEPLPTQNRSPEQWARAVFEGAPWPARWFLVVGWRYGLGLRFGPRSSPKHILGWAIVDRSADTITVQARSWLLTSQLVFYATDTHVSQSTFVRYDRRIAAAIWPPVSLLHRQIVPRLVRRAATRL